MVPSEVLQRVYSIKKGQFTGTIFTIDIDNKQYVVSARHLFEDVVNEVTVQVFHESQWKNLHLRLVDHCPDRIDISVLAADIKLTPHDLRCEASSKELFLSQDVFFLGFPYDDYKDAGLINRNFPMPFVKKAIVSNMQFENGINTFFLDGHNNPGFSGGPVVFNLHRTNEWKVFAVISGYHASKEPIYQGKTGTPFYYMENSGIIVSYDIKHAVDVIKAHPIGLSIVS